MTDFTHYANLLSRLGIALSAEQLPWDTPQLWNSCSATVRMWIVRIRQRAHLTRWRSNHGLQTTEGGGATWAICISEVELMIKEQSEGFFCTRSWVFRNLSAAAKARRLSSFMHLKLAFSPSVIRAIGLFRTVGSFCAFGLLRWHRKGTVLYLPHGIIYVEGRATTSVLFCETGGYS